MSRYTKPMLLKRVLFYFRILLLGLPLSLMIAQYNVRPELEEMTHFVGRLDSPLKNLSTAPLKDKQIRDILELYHHRLDKLEQEETIRSVVDKTFTSRKNSLLLIFCVSGALLLQLLEFNYDRFREENVKPCLDGVSSTTIEPQVAAQDTDPLKTNSPGSDELLSDENIASSSSPIINEVLPQPVNDNQNQSHIQ